MLSLVFHLIGFVLSSSASVACSAGSLGSLTIELDLQLLSSMKFFVSCLGNISVAIWCLMKIIM